MDLVMEIFEITQKFPPEKRYSQRAYLFAADRRSALPTAWSNEAEPKTTAEALYAAIKTIRGKPWPEKLFLDGLNAAIGQGFIHRMSGSGPISSLAHDGNTSFHAFYEIINIPVFQYSNVRCSGLRLCCPGFSGVEFWQYHSG